MLLIIDHSNQLRRNICDEDVKNFILNKNKVSRDYLPILRETINNDIGIRSSCYRHINVFPSPRAEPCQMFQYYPVVVEIFCDSPHDHMYSVAPPAS